MLRLRSQEADKIARSLNYRHNGLITAIAQDAETSELLMVAFMDPEAVKKTLMTCLAHYFSLDRKKLWLKGERSGHRQRVEEILVDCDNDALLLKVKQEVGACHQGYRSCFFRSLKQGKFRKVARKVFNPKEVYAE